MNDAVLEKIASEMERPDLLDLMGVAAKRKRDREDADLRRRTRQEQRRELARWVRSFKSDAGNSPLAFLRAVQAGDRPEFAWGPEVAAAVLGRLVTVTLEIDMSTHMRNCEHRYKFALTQAGEQALADPEEGRTAPGGG